MNPKQIALESVSVKVEIPGYSRVLEESQKRGVVFLCLAGRALLADPIGSGKTVEGVSCIKLYVHKQKAKKVLVVTTKSSLEQWESELKLAHLSTKLVAGTQTGRKTSILSSRASVLIATPASVRTDLKVYLKRGIDLLVYDESTEGLKNYDTAMWKAFRELSEKVKYVFLLSGQPMENNLTELYSQMELCRPNIVGSPMRFHRDFCVFGEIPIRRGNRIYQIRRIVEYKNIDQFHKLVDPYLLYRTEEEVGLVLPTATLNRVSIPMTPAQSDTYQKVLAKLANEPINTRGDLYKRTGYLLRASDSARFYGGQDSNKVDKVVEWLATDEFLSRGVIVYTQYYVVLDHLIEELQARDIDYVEISGRQAMDARTQARDRFNSGDVRVMLLTGAGGKALNLQGGSSVVLIDRPWSPMVLKQIVGRVRRRGQKSEDLQIYLLTSKGTADDYVTQVLSHKEKTIKDFFGMRSVFKGAASRALINHINSARS